MKVYKIRDRHTGKFSTGGAKVIDLCVSGNYSFVFNKTGKVWKRKADLEAHLRQFDNIPDNWEVVEYIMIESDVIPARDF